MKFKKFLSLILTLILMLNIVNVSVFATEENEDVIENEVVEISSLEDFLDFAKNCTLDTYSENKTFELLCDIDLTGTSFVDVPIFLGTFNGNNNTIYGINFSDDSDYQAIFRRVEATATIKNLRVEVSIDSDNSYIGGIAALNYGTIESCTFTGVLSGISYIGGIAAYNSGLIYKCYSYGGIFGKSQVGGIVGENSGTLIRCINYSEVNTDIENFNFNLGESLISNLASSSSTSDIVDIGGIAGVSDGIIRSCANYATIGYQHVGYNIGGIVGNQSGYVTLCYNYADVYGRKEVGGIVGQFQPYVSSVYSSSMLDSLSYELDVLTALTSNFATNAQSNSALISAEAENLNNSVGDTRVYLDSLIDQTTYLIDANIEEVNEISVTASKVIDDLASISEYFPDIFDDLYSVFGELEDAFDDISLALTILGGLEDIEGNISANTTLALDYVETAITYLESAFSNLSVSTNLSDLLENLELVTDDFNSALENLSLAIDLIDDSLVEIDNATTILGVSSSLLSTATGNLADASDDMQDVVVNLELVAIEISAMLTWLSEEDEIVFLTTDEEYANTKDLLNESISIIQSDIDGINATLTTAINMSVEDFNAVNAQFNVVMNLLIDIIQEVSIFDTADYTVNDVSYEDIDSVTAGKVSYCENYGDIDGDINIGGIVGAISFELSFDMEDDYKTEADFSQTSVYNGIAIIEACENSGSVVSKKDSAGGICGLQDFGLIIDSINESSVKSTEGDYVGGIAGYSSATIRSSYSKSIVSASEFVGGIVGYGYYIYDCYSLSSVTATSGRIGGIAGSAADKAVLSNNYFVSNDLGGLDGISFSTRAVAISYEELMEIEDIPEIFSALTVYVYEEDEYLTSFSLDYGDDFDISLLPILVSNDGTYGQWEDISLENLMSDIEITASFVPFITTLASAEKYNNISFVLVDGVYTHVDSLVINELDFDDTIYDSSFSIYIDGENTTINKVRVLNLSEDAAVEILVDGEWIETESEIEGKYITFNIETHNGDEISFRILPVESFNMTYLIALMVLILLVAYYFYKKSAKKKMNIELTV